MQITKGSSSLVVFLLVDRSDFYTPVPNQNPTVRISMHGGPFQATTEAARPIGDGWYKVQLTPQETSQVGQLIVTAAANGTAEWRDVMQVVAPQEEEAVGGGYTDVIRNGDFSGGTQEWIFYTNGAGNWVVANGVSEIKINRPGNNTQLYQKDINIVAGRYLLKFDYRANRERRMDFFLHGHMPPRTNLGIASRVDCTTNWQSFSSEYTLQPSQDNARLRFWFAASGRAGDIFYLRNVSLLKLS